VREVQGSCGAGQPAFFVLEPEMRAGRDDDGGRDDEGGSQGGSELYGTIAMQKEMKSTLTASKPGL
jgi:hypothetical protein